MDGSRSGRVEEALAHYGVKGMRWGVRRSEAQLRKARIQNTSQFQDLPESQKTALTTELRRQSDSKATKQFKKDLADPKSRVSRALQAQTGKKGSAVEIMRSEVKKAKESPKRKKNIAKLSDQVLQERITRLEKERKLGELQKSEGQKLAEDILKGGGSKAGKVIVAGAAVYGAKKAAEMLIGEDLANLIRLPKK